MLVVAGERDLTEGSRCVLGEKIVERWELLHPQTKIRSATYETKSTLSNHLF